MSVINWFPGHMAKARRMMQEQMKLVDVVVELLDARIPRASSNPMLVDMIGNKPHLIALNKTDLADETATTAWADVFRRQGLAVVLLDAASGKGTKALVTQMELAAKEIGQRWAARGVKNRATRAMILGIPNVGKSSLINRLAGTAAARTADKPGMTRGKQWIKIGRNLELLDTPGVLWPKLEDQDAAKRLAITGAIADDVYDLDEVTDFLLHFLCRQYPNRLAERFQLSIQAGQEVGELWEQVGRKRGCLLPGSVVDVVKVRKLLLTEVRSGRMGRLTFETGGSRN